MKIQATNQIIEWDSDLGQMAVLNPGDVAEVGDKLAAAKIASGDAEEAVEEVIVHTPKGKKGKKSEEAVEEAGGDKAPE